MPPKKRKPRKRMDEESQESQESPEERENVAEIHQTPDTQGGVKQKTVRSRTPKGTHDNAATNSQSEPQKKETPKKPRKPR